MHITEGQLDHPDVNALLDTHLRRARSETAVGSAHALDLDGLKTPDIRFFTLWQDDDLLGCGALKTLSADHGEVKSMHTAEAHRRKGAGSVMLSHIIAAAREHGLTRLSLETGSWPFFIPAHALYRAHGFVDCGPFGDYRPDPNSVFMTLDLGEAEAVDTE
jgi:putative acetyltransferase